MKLRSRGLGRKELVMDFREYTVVRDGDEVVVMGTIHEPVHWDFSIRICEDDLPGILQLTFDRKLLGLLLRAAFKRNRRGHWSKSRDEHLAEAKRRRAATIEKFAEPSRANHEPGGEEETAARPGRSAGGVRSAATR
ncbi:MAG: hypothetical protein U0807_05465 [Candidatus Binatia bacterium]